RCTRRAARSRHAGARRSGAQRCPRTADSSPRAVASSRQRGRSEPSPLLLPPNPYGLAVLARRRAIARVPLAKDSIPSGPLEPRRDEDGAELGLRKGGVRAGRSREARRASSELPNPAWRSTPATPY